MEINNRQKPQNPLRDVRIRKYDTYQRPGSAPRFRSVNDFPLQLSRVAATHSDAKHSSMKPTQNIAHARPAAAMPRTSTNKDSGATNEPAQKSTSTQTVSPIRRTTILALMSVKNSMTSSTLPNFEQQIQKNLQYVKQRSKRKRTQRIFYAFGMSIFLLAGAASLQTILHNQQAKQQLQILGEQTFKQDEQGVAEGTSSDPAEDTITAEALAKYQVAAHLPRYIRIPDIDVFARIKHTATDSDGAVAAPGNINDASWYNGSVLPGSGEGASLLLGHVSGWTAPGVFKKLTNLKNGTRFEIEKGSGEKLSYEVTHTESLPTANVNMASILSPENPGEHDLKMITCSGKFNRETEQFEERFIVYAKIIR